jgi:hypothetical protein
MGRPARRLAVLHPGDRSKKYAREANRMSIRATLGPIGFVPRRTHLPKPNYQAEKRRKELERKRKSEAKEKKKTATGATPTPAREPENP